MGSTGAKKHLGDLPLYSPAASPTSSPAPEARRSQRHHTRRHRSSPERPFHSRSPAPRAGRGTSRSRRGPTRPFHSPHIRNPSLASCFGSGHTFATRVSPSPERHSTRRRRGRHASPAGSVSAPRTRSGGRYPSRTRTREPLDRPARHGSHARSTSHPPGRRYRNSSRRPSHQVGHHRCGPGPARPETPPCWLPLSDRRIAGHSTTRSGSSFRGYTPTPSRGGSPVSAYSRHRSSSVGSHGSHYESDSDVAYEWVDMFGNVIDPDDAYAGLPTVY